MTDLATIQDGLVRIAGELDGYAGEVAQMVGDNPGRDDLMQEAMNRMYAGKNESLRANGCLRLAIREQMGGEHGH